MKHIRYILFVFLAQAYHTGFAQQERLVGQADYGNNGVAYTPGDTFFYTYSDGRYLDTVLSGYDFDYSAGMLYNTAGAVYNNNTQSTQTFDGNNRRLTNLVQVWNASSSSYRDSTQTLYTYDAANNVLTQAVQNWNTNTNSWRNAINNLYTYNGHLLTENISQTWDTVSNNWLNYFQELYTYDGNNNNTQWTIQTWSTATAEWANDRNYVLTYTAANLLATNIWQTWSDVSVSWVNTKKLLYSYDANNNNYNYLVQNWVSSAWVNQTQHNATFSNTGDRLTYTDQSWNGSAWVNQLNNIYTYDGNHNQLSDISQTWSAGSAAWANATRSRSAYDNDNNITNLITDTWNAGAFWQATTSDGEAFYYYQDYYPSGIAVLAAPAGSLSVYPSPASSLMTISLRWDAAQPATIAIYDASGRICRQWETPGGGSYQAAISVSALPPGIYSLSAKGTTGALTKTFGIIR